ncbi:pseudouridine synthase [Podospora didyma]|uniref:tRNA pseudouridine synthase 1 n=1 Tax=Podospora didyma TaxID=330526 RepID=A0AAE0K2F0_9PEZI|nr:pseudouridine synthase [Podospora didyma]
MAADDTPSNASAAAPAPVSEQQSESSNQKNGRGNTRGGYKGGKRGGGGGHKDKGRKGAGFGSSKWDMPDKREQVQNSRSAKRQKVITDEADGTSYMSIPFTAEEIAAEERRPKRKVAVLIGYAGTGYHGIQINHKEKTIEGDIFAAFVATGAISKANADDPKKSSLARCARTDKGVHAAGNVLSLKLIVEDEDIVKKINSHLPDQIRVWAIQRASNSFSCYQACESRWYEYLMPSYALLPPQPHSFLGKRIAESAKAKGVADEYNERLDDVKDFWGEVEKNDIQPILDNMAPDVRTEVLRILRDSTDMELAEDAPPAKAAPKAGKKNVPKADEAPAEAPQAEAGEAAAKDVEMVDEAPAEAPLADAEAAATVAPVVPEVFEKAEPTPVELGVKEVKAAYIAAKRRYRVTPARLEKLQKALDLYLGTHNFHNYTVLKSANDPSAKRHIKSFEVNTTPIPIRDTEWLSLKIHGQSFMMHQIRKMVALAVMIVRCGAPLDLVEESYGPRRISIPKAPGLGLMLERPMFSEYNKKAISLGREAIDFAKYDDRIQEFKDQHIYRRMFEVEEQENSFHLFFNQVDNFRTDYFLWVTAGGVGASYERQERGGEKVPKALQAELGDEADGVVEVGN